jgi:small nuclear ribonucleoprotein (snRNP)-like protein
MTENQRGTSTVLQAVWIVAGLLVALAAILHFVVEMRSSDVKFETPYQAVLLSNGSVYFGRLQGYGGHDPVLTDVYYIVSQQNPETKQVQNSLVKRGKELHEPDRMYLNPNQILFVEPVGPNSKVAQLIAQQPKQ